MPSGVELATAWVRLVPSMEGAQGEVAKALGPAEKEAEEAGKRSGSRFTSGLKTFIAAGAITLAAKGIADAFNTGMEELKFGEQVSAQTDQLIKNTGAAFSTGWIEDYTLSLSKVSGVSEESLQQAGNKLLEFGITNEDTYKRAVDGINNMAAKTGDAEAAGKALAKSLQDPTLAVGALRKQGVAFTADQEAMIASMVEAGDVAGAQALILDQVEATYGGMAEAAGGTLEGNLNKLNNTWENMAGTAVETLMPAITGLVEGLSGFFDWISQNEWVLPVLATAIGVILVAAFIAWTASIWAANVALLANPITWIILAIVALIAIIILLVMNWDAVVAFLTDVWNGFITWFTGVMDGFFAWWNGLWTGVWEWIVSVWNGIIAAVSTAINWVWSILVSVGTAIASWWNGMWNGIITFFVGIWVGINDVINGVKDAFGRVFGAIADIVKGAFNGVVGVVKGIVNSVIDVINGIIDGINGLVGTAGAAIGINIKLGKLPRLAEGATILPKRGGTLAVLAEAGRPETVVDTGLMNRALEEGIGGGDPGVLVVVDQDGELIGRMRVEAAGEVGRYDKKKAGEQRRGFKGGA